MIIWITGLPGAGKTTLAEFVKSQIELLNAPCLWIDGDDYRTRSSFRFGHERADRESLANTYLTVARIAASQGIRVIVSTVSQFEFVDEFFKGNPEHLLIVLETSAELRRIARPSIYAEGDEDQVVLDWTSAHLRLFASRLADRERWKIDVKTKLVQRLNQG